MRSSRPTPSFRLLHKAHDAVQALTARQGGAAGRALFYFFSLLLVVSVVGLLYLLNNHFLIAVPAHGGSWQEGLVGTPRFINPVLAVSDADQDLSALVYSGLMKATPEGTYVPDLAESCTTSGDGKTYTCVLKSGATFQDGTPVSADDVIFTIEKTQDPAIKSPERANWSGVAVQKIDDKTVSFTLKEAYAPFIENLSLGILPKHLWQNIGDADFAASALNMAPVGSGPFVLNAINRTASGVPSSAVLHSFAHYTLGAPYLDEMTFTFFANEDDLIDALKRGDVSAASGISPDRLSELSNMHAERAPYNRIFGVFFNENQSEVLRDGVVRQALSDAIDRSALVDAVLHGYGKALEGPLPPSVLPQDATDATDAADSLQKAKDELAKDGWVPGPNGTLQKTTGSGKKATTQTLSFTLATGDVPELRAASQYVSGVWKELGVQADTAVYDQGDLTQNVIRPRKFDALLFGEVIGREPDLYAFWNSSQRLDPGLNIAQYANPAVDKIVEELRGGPNDSLRQILYRQFSLDVTNDMPAVFLYAPDFVYIVPNDTAGLDLGFIETPSDRFLSVNGWHSQTDYVWPPIARYVLHTP